MAPPTILFLLIASFFLAPPPHLQVQAADQAFTSVVISQKGLDFLKDLLVTQAVSSIIPLQLPKISKSRRIPFLGNVNMVLSNITIYGIDVGPSHFVLGDDGIAIIASGVTCNLSMNWHYSYSTWIAPVVVSDEGRASIQVEGLEVGLSLGLGIEEGTLKLTLKDCGCYVKEISIKLDGGASWLYQGMIDAFEEQIGSAVETSMTKELKDGVLKLDSFMQALPKEVPLDDNTALNMTFVNDPVLSNSSIGFEINGLFGRRNASVSEYHIKDSLSEYRNKDSQPLVSCSDPSKMLGISLDEAVFNSVAAAYFNAEFMQWIVDKIPDQSFLNTAGWRFIIPQLYKKYPNHDMDLNISLYSPPVVRISEHNIDATIYSDLIIDVLEEFKNSNPSLKTPHQPPLKSLPPSSTFLPALSLLPPYRRRHHRHYRTVGRPVLAKRTAYHHNMIKTLNPYTDMEKTAEIMSRYRPIAPKPEITANPAGDNPSMSQKIRNSPYLRNLWPHLQARPTRTRKRGRTALSPTAFKRQRSHHMLGFSTPCHMKSPAKNLRLDGFARAFSKLPIVTNPAVVPAELELIKPCGGGEENLIDLNTVAAEIPEEKDLLKQLQGNSPAPPPTNTNVIEPQPIRPVGSSISVGCISADPSLTPAAQAPKKAEDVEEEMESEALPVIISDSRNKVRMANAAYKEMVGQPECPWLDAMVAGDGRFGGKRISGEVSLQLSDSGVPVSSNGFSCWVRIEWGNEMNKHAVNTFCDVMKLSCESKDYLFEWRFHTHSREGCQSSSSSA